MSVTEPSVALKTGMARQSEGRLGPQLDLLLVGDFDCPRTSVTNYHFALRNIPEERRSQDEYSLINV